MYRFSLYSVEQSRVHRLMAHLLYLAVRTHSIRWSLYGEHIEATLSVLIIFQLRCAPGCAVRAQQSGRRSVTACRRKKPSLSLVGEGAGPAAEANRMLYRNRGIPSHSSVRSRARRPSAAVIPHAQDAREIWITKLSAPSSSQSKSVYAKVSRQAAIRGARCKRWPPSRRSPTMLACSWESWGTKRICCTHEQSDIEAQGLTGVGIVHWAG